MSLNFLEVPLDLNLVKKVNMLPREVFNRPSVLSLMFLL